MPLAPTVNDALVPARTVLLAGCDWIVGATWPLCVVTTALLLTTVPATFVTSTRYVPASLACTLEIESVAVTALAFDEPLMLANVAPPSVLFCH